jgi:hypothetical protein
MEPGEMDRLEKIDEQIRLIKKAAEQLKNLSGGAQAIDCNVQRILASLKMLEINFSDLLEVVNR